MAEFKVSYITEEERKALLIQNLADRPNAMSSYGRAKMSAEDVKKAFDDQFILVVKRHNLLHESVEKIRGEAQTERLESLENRTDTVEGRLGAQNDANSIEDVIQRVANLESLLDDPDEQDTLNESYKGVRARVKTNENNILNNAGAISENANAISENNANIAGHEGRLESLEIAMGNHYNMILTNNQNISTLSDKVQTDSQGIETNAGRIRDINDYLNREPSDIGNIFLDVYPVGSIYMSVNPTDPAYLFGGSWVALKDRFLVGAGGSYGVKAEGGEAVHTLTLGETPSHAHIQQATSNYDGWARKQVQAVGSTSGSAQDVTTVATNGTQYSAGTYASAVYTQQNGGGQPHNNIPPYYAVYMWRREK